MADKTGIEWTDATWNPVRGCSRVSEGCRNCYAEAVAARFSGPGQPYEGLAKRVGGEPRWTGVVRLIPEHLGDPLRWKRPRRVFVNSMSDLFHERLPFEAIAAVFGVMAAAPQHEFQVLTKRPERAIAFFDHMKVAGSIGATLHGAVKWALGYDDPRRPAIQDSVSWPLPNVWLGTSVEDQATADQRIPLLLQCSAAVRFVSYEPALGPVDFTHLGGVLDALRGGSWTKRYGFVNHSDIGRLDWIIVGGESGRGHRTLDLAWVEAVAEQCSAAGVALFLKQDSGPKPGRQGRIPGRLWIKQWPVVAEARL